MASSAPEHEETAKRIVAEEFPEAFVCASHEVAPEFREYERISTAVVNAYLGPVMQGYIRAAGRPAEGARADRDAASDAVEWRRDRLRHGGAAAGAHGAVGPFTGVVAAQAIGR
jgi:N-methylhydantoinase A